MGEDPEMSDPAPLIVPRRFCGPASSGNGGWTAGALAALVAHDCPENRARSGRRSGSRCASPRRWTRR